MGIILQEKNFIHLDINNTQDRFKRIFSKMEVMMAYEVIDELINSRKIESISITTPDSIYRGQDPAFNGYLNERVEILGDRNLTATERKFIEDHDAMQKKLNMRSIRCKTDTVSLWRDNKVEKLLDDRQCDYFIITGFDTETEILVNALEAVDRSKIPIIVSDCVSCPSERKHFSALEILSRFSYILDSRDIISLMGW